MLSLCEVGVIMMSDVDAPVLVVTVGTSPMPVLLALAANAAEVSLAGVVLLHSDETAGVAERVRLAVGFAQTEIPLSRVRTVGIGADASDVAAVVSAVEEQFIELEPSLPPASPIGQDEDEPSVGVQWGSGRRVLLDYTGGTKSMTVGVVGWHDRRGGAPADRSYVDATHDVLRRDDGTWEPVHPPVWLTLGVIATAHGYTLTPDSRSGTSKAGDDAEQQVATAVTRLVKDHVTHAARHGCPSCAALLGGVHDVGNHVEIAKNVAARRLRGGERFTEFDVVLRWGHHVVCIETKTSGDRAVWESGWAVRRGDTVFGSGAATLILHIRGRAPSRDLQKTGALRPSAYVGDFTILTLRRLERSPNPVHDHLFPAPPQFVDRQVTTSIAPAGHLRPPSPLLVVTAVGSSRLAPVSAAFAALHLYRRDRPGLDAGDVDVRILTSGTVDETALQASVVTVLQAGGFSRARQDVSIVRVDVTNAAAVTDAALRLVNTVAAQAVWFDGTAGTKAATAGLVRAAAVLSNSSIVLSVTDPRERRVTIRRGDGMTVQESPRVEYPWQTILAGLPAAVRDFWSSDEDATAILDALAGVIPGAVSGMDLLDRARVFPSADLLRGVETRVIALPVVDRIVAVVILDPPPQRPDQPPEDVVTEGLRATARTGMRVDEAVAEHYGDAVQTVLVPSRHLAGGPWRMRSRDVDFMVSRLRSVDRPGLPVLVVPCTMTGRIRVRADLVKDLKPLRDLFTAVVEESHS